MEWVVSWLTVSAYCGKDNNTFVLEITNNQFEESDIVEAYLENGISLICDQTVNVRNIPHIVRMIDEEAFELGYINDDGRRVWHVPPGGLDFQLIEEYGDQFPEYVIQD